MLLHTYSTLLLTKLHTLFGLYQSFPNILFLALERIQGPLHIWSPPSAPLGYDMCSGFFYFLMTWTISRDTGHAFGGALPHVSLMISLGCGFGGDDYGGKMLFPSHLKGT